MSKGDTLEKHAYNNTEGKLEGNNINNKEHLDKDNTRQETFITIDGDFWEKLNELLDSKVEAIVGRVLASRPRGRKSKAPKSAAEWAEIEKNIRILLGKHSYVSYQLLQTDTFLMQHFGYPQQWTRLRAKLLEGNSSDFVQFRLSESGRACWYLTYTWNLKKAKREALQAQKYNMKTKPKRWI